MWKKRNDNELKQQFEELRKKQSDLEACASAAKKAISSCNSSISLSKKLCDALLVLQHASQTDALAKSVQMVTEVEQNIASYQNLFAENVMSTTAKLQGLAASHATLKEKEKSLQRALSDLTSLEAKLKFEDPARLYHLTRLYIEASTSYREALESCKDAISEAEEEHDSLLISASSELMRAQLDFHANSAEALGMYESDASRLLEEAKKREAQRDDEMLELQNGQRERQRLIQVNRCSSFLGLITAPDFTLVTSLVAQLMPEQIERVVSDIVVVADYFRTVVGLIKLSVTEEVQGTQSSQQLFRTNSISTRLLTGFCKHVGRDFVKHCLQATVMTALNSPDQFETNPSKAGGEEASKEHAKNLAQLCSDTLDRIISSEPPPILREIAAHLQKEAVRKFKDPATRITVTGGFVMLRFLCPAILNPVSHSILPEAPPDKRALILVSKALQNLSNGMKFREEHMQPLNEWLDANTERLHRFYLEFATPVDGEHHPNVTESEAQAALKRLKTLFLNDMPRVSESLEKYGNQNVLLETINSIAEMDFAESVSSVVATAPTDDDLLSSDEET